MKPVSFWLSVKTTATENSLLMDSSQFIEVMGLDVVQKSLRELFGWEAASGLGVNTAGSAQRSAWQNFPVKFSWWSLRLGRPVHRTCM